MQQKGQEFFRKVYRQEPSTGAFIFEIALDNYRELFNEWDPAPFRIRDVDPDLLTFLELCSHEIPLKYPLKICFRAPAEIRDKMIEEQVLNGFRSYLEYEQALLRKKIRRSGKKILINTLAALGFLTIAFIIKQHTPVTLLSEVLLEGMFVGGWVFMWESISSFFFDRTEMQKSLREYSRLVNAESVFIYELDPDAQV